MFEDFLKNSHMEDGIKPSKKRVKKNIAAVLSLIETEEDAMTRRKIRIKRLLVTAVISVISMFLLLTVVNAATEGSVVRFFMGGKEIEGDYSDYVDHDGFRHITFSAVLPIDADNFAVIYDVDKPWGENVRVITEEADPEFIGKIRQYRAADDRFWHDLTAWYEEHNITSEDIGEPDSESAEASLVSAEVLGRPAPEPEDFGLVFKDSELCSYRFVNGTARTGGYFGGAFMINDPAGTPTEAGGEIRYDTAHATKIFKETLCYYVGKE